MIYCGSGTSEGVEAGERRAVFDKVATISQGCYQSNQLRLTECCPFELILSRLFGVYSSSELVGKVEVKAAN